MKSLLFLALLIAAPVSFSQGGGGSTGTLPAFACGDPGTAGTVSKASRVYVYLPAQAGQEITVCRANETQTIAHFGAASVVDPYGSVLETETPDGQGGVIIVTTPRHTGESQSQQWWRHSIALGQSTQLTMPISGRPNGPPSSLPATQGSDLETEWTSGGATHRVRTPVKPGETPAQTWSRHSRWVQAGMDLYPPDKVK